MSEQDPGLLKLCNWSSLSSTHGKYICVSRAVLVTRKMRSEMGSLSIEGSELSGNLSHLAWSIAPAADMVPVAADGAEVDSVLQDRAPPHGLPHTGCQGDLNVWRFSLLLWPFLCLSQQCADF